MSNNMLSQRVRDGTLVGLLGMYILKPPPENPPRSEWNNNVARSNKGVVFH